MKFVFENEDLPAVFFTYLVKTGKVPNKESDVTFKVKMSKNDVTVIVSVTPVPTTKDVS